MYLKRLFIVIILSLSAAYVAGLLFDQIYKKRWQVLFFRKTDELIKDKTDFDIIFLGNSRVHFGINPYYIDSVTKLKSFNFANGGSDAEDILLTSTVYLHYHPAPKLVIISLDMGALKINESLKTCFHYLYYLQDDTISRHMKQAGYLTTWMKPFPFLKYSFFNEYNRSSLFVKGKPYPVFDHNIYKGFLNIHQHINSSAPDLYNTRTVPDTLSKNAVAYFRNAVSSLQQKGSRVVFVFPPERSSSVYRNIAFRKTTDSVFASITNDYHLEQWHFENDVRYTNEYFVDDIHLNEPGTKIYSVQLADSVKKILKL